MVDMTRFRLPALDTAGRIHLPRAVIAAAALGVAGVLAWQALAQSGVPQPMDRHLSHGAVVVDSAVLVLREGLEAILVLAALTASMVGANQPYRKPVAAGAGLAFLASVGTWFLVVAVIAAVDAPELYVQAVTGLLAVAVLVVIMNWFFHKVYWTGWIGHHQARKRNLLAADDSRSLRFGLLLLGFTAVYREGFEIVLFLQSLRLQAGSAAVLEGVAVALVLLGAVSLLTFAAHHKLPYKRMLVLTGVMLGFVFVVMVGESAQELQQAGWLSATSLPVPMPAWMGVWFAVFPNLEGLVAQAAAALVVLGSYFGAEYVRVWRRRRPTDYPRLVSASR